MPAAKACIAILLIFAGICSAHGTAEPVKVSLLVASPGDKVFQCAGHVAIRLECPAYGLDNVFSYETDRGSLAGQVFGRAKGRYSRIAFSDYCREFIDEGRGITSYPLNLTDSQIRRLWMFCDGDAEQSAESNFNIRWRNCNSAASDKIAAALGGESIVMARDSLVTLDNGDFLKAILLPSRPWAALVLTAALGADCDDTDSWRTRMFPTAMPAMLTTATICSADGTSRPLLAGEPVVLAAEASDDSTAATPGVVFAAVLVLSVAVSLADLRHRLPRLVAIADRTALVLLTVTSLALIAVSVLPLSIGGAWNWLYIPLNPLPAIVWLIWRRRRWTPIFFLIYGVAAALFVAAPLFTSNAGTWSSLLSAAIALRVLSHYIPIILKYYE